MNVLKYKNYIGSVEFSDEDDCLFGKILFLPNHTLISYEGSTISELRKDFEEAVDDYIRRCEELGLAPQKSYSGSMNVRISPSMHAKVAEGAASEGISINAFIKEAIDQRLATIGL